jgi:uncharacterized protein (TIGR00369 family)
MQSGEQPSVPTLGPPIGDGTWAGWSKWTSQEPFEDYVGPFYARREPDGSITCGFRPEAKNLNGMGALHGGALVTFADYAIFLIATDQLAGLDGVTVTLNTEFVGAARTGGLLTCRGDVVKAGRSLLFVRGQIDAAGDKILNFSGVIKIMRPRA